MSDTSHVHPDNRAENTVWWRGDFCLTRRISRATERQIGFLRKLAAERELGMTPNEVEHAARNGKNGLISMEDASRWIERALTKPLKQEALPGTQSPVVPVVPTPERVPAGRYAVTVKGDKGLSFYRVDRPSEGRWAGYVFVRQLASETEYPVRGERRNVVLNLIARDAREAAVRYGHELGHCAICGRVLTDADSRAKGIGPICAERVGW